MIWDASQVIELGVLGTVAGSVSAAAGGGSLLTFPLLVALGLPALTANLSNSVAQSAGYVAIARGYKLELAGQRRRILVLVPAALGGAAGGIAGIELGSPATFRAIAPGLVLLACALFAMQPRLAPALRRQHRASRPWLHVSVGIVSAYGAYFGAGGGVLLLAVLAAFLDDHLQRLNALNRALVVLINVPAAAIFVAIGPVSWPAIAILAPSTSLGGWVGVSLVRRMSPRVLRTTVLVIGLAAAGYLCLTSW
jgi:uncharacterized protein